MPAGGWLDGALGVVYALEAARAWTGERRVGVDVVSFADEEGASSAASEAAPFAANSRRSDRRRLEPRRAASARAHGSRPGRFVDKQIDPARHIAYLEAHIEQGPVLEQTGDDIGVVEGIVGMRRLRIRFTGRADHAGTTPMAMRADAAAALFDFAQKAARR